MRVLPDTNTSGTPWLQRLKCSRDRRTLNNIGFGKFTSWTLLVAKKIHSDSQEAVCAVPQKDMNKCNMDGPQKQLKNTAALIDFYLVWRIILVCRPEAHWMALVQKDLAGGLPGKKRAKGRKRRWPGNVSARSGRPEKDFMEPKWDRGI